MGGRWGCERGEASFTLEWEASVQLPVKMEATAATCTADYKLQMLAAILRSPLS